MERKLTAILSADVEGYSRLMGEDEVATIRTLTAYREVMGSLIQQHRGRVVDMPGDNLLAEFASVVDAVQCAVEIQQALKARNTELPEQRRMEFRIGINLGDVVVDGERIYGDGVNIAARVEGLAEGGGICVSGTAYDHVENKLALGYEYLGEHAVKNITKPVRVYRVRMGPGPTSPREKAPALELPDKPSIAVLPFVNMSGEPEQEYFSDGITEDIITALSNISSFLVIARNSTFTYKGKAVRVQQVSEELGTRYVLEGSVRKVGDRVRITAQLVDAGTGHHLWAERFDRHLQDIFALQDEITQRIVEALQVRLTEGEQVRVWRRQTENLEAWHNSYSAREHFNRFTKEDNAQARQFAQKAIELDAKFSRAYAGLAWTYWADARFGWTDSQPESFARAVELAQKALTLDDSVSETYALLGAIHLYQGQHEQAIAEGEKAIGLNPNGADVAAMVAMTLNFSGRPNEALALVQKAMRLSPYYPAWYLNQLGFAYHLTGEYEEAIRTYKKCLDRNPDAMLPRASLAGIYGELGREEEARAEVREVLRREPKYSIERYRKALFFKDEAQNERFVDALRRAGLPE